MGKDGIPFLEKVLIGDEYKEVEDDFSDIDGPGSEAVLFSLKRRAAIEAARYYDFEDLLTRFYYGDLKAACALSADQQIEKAVRVLVRIGPRTERTLPIGARFELLSKTITNGTAQVTCSMIPEGRYKVSLRKRGCAGAEVWIPVEIEVLGVY